MNIENFSQRDMFLRTMLDNGDGTLSQRVALSGSGAFVEENYTEDLSDSVLSYTYTNTHRYKLISISFTTTATITETIKIKVNGIELYNNNPTINSSFTEIFDNRYVSANGIVEVTITNNGLSGIIDLVAQYEVF